MTKDNAKGGFSYIRYPVFEETIEEHVYHPDPRINAILSAAEELSYEGPFIARSIPPEIEISTTSIGSILARYHNILGLRRSYR